MDGTHLRRFPAGLRAMHNALALLAVLPAFTAPAPASVTRASAKIHISQTEQDFSGCLLFADVFPALLQKRQHLFKDTVSKRRSTAPGSKHSMCESNPKILNRIKFPFMFGKDKDEKRNSLESSTTDVENLEDQAVAYDCDWEYRDCDTRVNISTLIQQFGCICNLLCLDARNFFRLTTLLSASAVRDHGVPGHP